MTAALPAGGTESATFAGSGGVRLHWRAWTFPAPRAALLLSHGLGEHAGRYARLAEYLVPHGISVHAIDHRGHGLSGGTQGHAESFRHFTDDFELFRQEAASRLSPDVPVFLLGHSMGGLVALRYLQTHPDAPLRGAVISAPLLGVRLVPPRWKTALAGLLSRLAPRLRLGNEIDPAQLSHDEEYVRTYRDDPLVHPWITPRLYVEMLASAAAARDEGAALGLPLLFVIPGADPVLRSDVSELFARGLACETTVRVYPELFHEAHNERERERVLGDVAGWILERSA